MWTDVTMQSRHPLDDIMQSDTQISPRVKIGNTDLKIDETLYGYPAKGVLFLESPGDIMRDLWGDTRTRLLSNILGALRKYERQKWPVIFDGPLIKTPNKSFKASDKDWHIWGKIITLLEANKNDLIKKLKPGPLDSKFQLQTLTFINENKCSFIEMAGVNETACCYIIARILAAKVWTTFLIDTIHPIWRPLYAHQYEPPVLTAIVEPALCGSEVFPGFRLRDPKSFQNDWVCFSGIGVKEFSDRGNKPLYNMGKVLKSLGNLKSRTKPDLDGNWRARDKIRINPPG
ncbi:hypothetical protein NBZ79_15490 [Sneathiella marina]|uniref:Uncharacterized protein n=1 Tax=Sneathiella marina TaxID=2950108 RepID=A0ABY4W134_9PROT|nr:hypothetical protein [Sneathiella marina]USG60569.1 hypothetical protein NBZ79_15490 [Sneathiella marina]